MKVLHIWDGRAGTPERLQIGFVRKLSTLCDLGVYFPKSGDLEINREQKISYTKNASIELPFKEFKPDIILIPEFPISNLCKVNENIKKFGVPVVLIDADWYATPQEYYKKVSHYVISRASVDPSYFTDIDSVWLPLSVCDNEFYTNLSEYDISKRRNKVAFIGSGFGSRNKHYEKRNEVIKKLGNNSNFIYIGHRNKNIYVETLKSFRSALSCSFSELRMPPAKVWEIMTCGTALLVSPFNNSELLFGKEQCFFTYKYDLSNVEDVIKEIVNDDDKVQYVVKNAVDVIRKKHLDSIRIKEIYDVLYAIASGTKIPKVWRRENERT